MAFSDRQAAWTADRVWQVRRFASLEILAEDELVNPLAGNATKTEDQTSMAIDIHHLINLGMSSLDDRQYELVFLHFFEHFNLSQIAKIYRVTPPALTHHLKKAIRAMREKIIATVGAAEVEQFFKL